MSAYFSDDTLTLLLGDARTVLSGMDDGSVNCVVTSPPYYGLRDYEGNPDQIGLEENPAKYVAALVEVFDEVRRVLADDGTVWLNLADTYAGSVSGGPTSPSSTLRGNGHVGGGPKQKSGAGRPSRRRDAAAVAGPRRRANDGVPAKNMLGIPWRVAFALQDAGWVLRNAIVWHKPNAMPESVTDRLSNRCELLFLLTAGPRYWFDLDVIREPIREEWRGRGTTKVHGAVASGMVKHGTAGSTLREPPERGRNPGDVWSISTTPLAEAHFATFPVELPRRCILAGCRPGGTVLDPFSGAGTTALAAQQLGRRAIGIDIVENYHKIALRRMCNAPLPFDEGGAA